MVIAYFAFWALLNRHGINLEALFADLSTKMPDCVSCRAPMWQIALVLDKVNLIKRNINIVYVNCALLQGFLIFTSIMPDLRSSGYGPSNPWKKLILDRGKVKDEPSEPKILGYFKLKGLKEGFALGKIDANKNELMFAELVQYLDERSLSLVMRDAKDNVGEALRKLRAHYIGSGKPRIITLYKQLTTLKISYSESITNYIIKDGERATALDTAVETVSDPLLVAIALNYTPFPNNYTPFVAAITQQKRIQNFQNLNRILEILRKLKKLVFNKRDGVSKITAMKRESTFVTASKNKGIICYSCDIPGHKSS